MDIDIDKALGCDARDPNATLKARAPEVPNYATMESLTLAFRFLQEFRTKVSGLRRRPCAPRTGAVRSRTALPPPLFRLQLLSPAAQQRGRVLPPRGLQLPRV